MANAIEIAGLNKTYRRMIPWARREVFAVRDLSLNIPHGEIFGLLGPNGAGKTTTIKMLAGLIAADSGRISWPVHGRRPPLGAVLEGSRNLYWRLSAWDNIYYFGEVKGVSRKQLRQQGEELLTLFELIDKADKPAQTLSRGMQQKLAVVLAFLGEPDLLLLDEPTLGLDVASSLTIQRLLKQLCRDRKITIVVTTHQMDVARNLCQRLGIMRDGQVAVNEEVEHLVDLFTRQDYIVRLDDSDWARLQPAMIEVEYELLDEQRPGQTGIRFKLAGPEEFYPLVRRLEEQGVIVRDFHQERPTLEDIFLRVTGLHADAETGTGGVP